MQKREAILPQQKLYQKVKSSIYFFLNRNADLFKYQKLKRQCLKFKKKNPKKNYQKFYEKNTPRWINVNDKKHTFILFRLT